jgi:hypothetical protein
MIFWYQFYTQNLLKSYFYHRYCQLETYSLPQGMIWVYLEKPVALTTVSRIILTTKSRS